MALNYEEVIQQVKGMSESEINELLKKFNSTFTYDKIKTALTQTMNDLAVGDLVFQTDTIESSDSNYPKFTIDVIVSEIAEREDFDGLHYGLWLEDYEHAKDKGIEQQMKSLQRFIKSAKSFKLDNFDTLLFTVEDGDQVFAALIDVLEESSRKPELYKEAMKLYKDWMFQFRVMQEVIEEQILLVVLPMYVRSDFKEAQRIITRALDISEQRGEWILEYLTLINKFQRPSLNTAYKRVQTYIDKNDECYKDIQALVSRK